MRPYDVENESQLRDLESDGFPSKFGPAAILHVGDFVWVHGPNSSGIVRIERNQFNALVDWYMADQPTKSK
jgi:hypothetical protein